MIKKVIRTISMGLIILFVIFHFSDVESKGYEYKLIEIEEVSRYFEDRVAYQQIETEPVEYQFDKTDNSIASLLIIKDKKIYLFKDGYDNPADVANRKSLLEMENKLIPDLWTNKIDNDPDYVRITQRRIELMKNVTREFVTKNYKPFYIKIRDAFIKKHVDIFRSLMINRKESGLYVDRKPIPGKLYEKATEKHSIIVCGKTIDEKIYYAEDADGDGITETFTVTLADGFNWGYKSGPNLLFIFNNHQKEITQIIGNLTKLAYYGTPEEEKIIMKTFPETDIITDMIDDLYQIDRDLKKILEENKVDIKEEPKEEKKIN